ncbi:MAG: MATE family efflux transporter [Polyangiaceae bacterium]|nr:MATE family efflux transporter [Polyangiaceae bacterium]
MLESTSRRPSFLVPQIPSATAATGGNVAAWRREARALLALSLPIAFSHLGQTLLGVVDTAVVGRVGELHLGAAGLGNALFFTVTVLGMGVMLGLDPVIAQAMGAGEANKARRALWQGVWLAGLVGVPLMLVVLLASGTLELMGIAPDSAVLTRAYVMARLPSLVPFLVFVALRCYLQAAGTTRPVVTAVVLANIVNVPLSIVLVFGDEALTRAGLPPLGLPALGVAGAGWASTACTLVQVVVLADAMRRSSSAAEPNARQVDAVVMKRALLLGLPIGLQLVAEFGVFALVNVAMANLDSTSLAAHQVALTLASATFMVPVGIGAATSVRVGRAIGQGDATGTRRAGIVGLGLGTTFMIGSALCFWLFPESLAAIITSDAKVIDAAVGLLLVAAVFQISDGVQAVGAGALRGAGDTRFTFLANVAGHYLIGLPLGLVLTFVLAAGAPGLWWGLSAGLTVVAIALLRRFLRISAGAIARV